VVRIQKESVAVIFAQDRDALRRMYRDAWQKHTAGEPVSPLEDQIATVVAEHPEYRAEVETADADRDYAPDGGRTNPFLHMGLHLALREQVATDRPPGIRRLYEQVTREAGERHLAEHRMIDCLAETLWEAQAANRAPDEARYLERLRQLAGTV
jgi:hypothetical protein